MVCSAQQQTPLAKAAAAGVSLPALLAAHPAFALVDDRLATEGTGKIFGINDPALFWVLAVSWPIWMMICRPLNPLYIPVIRRLCLTLR
jgi:photosystem II PsbW protein